MNLACALLLSLTVSPGDQEEPARESSRGAVSGRLEWKTEGLTLRDLGPTVVYLEPCESITNAAAPHPEPVTIRQIDATFRPQFSVLTLGQELVLPNDDTIVHNVFSVSTPNDFDFGLYRPGQTRTVRFEHPGAVHLYCSIHASMRATVFIAPTRHHAIVDARGSFRLDDVPAGSHRLQLWNQRLPSQQIALEVEADCVTTVLLPIEPRGKPKPER